MKFQVERKESVAEATCTCMYSYDAVQKRKPFLDQLVEGLEEFQFGKPCHLLPHVFLPISVSKKCKPDSVLKVLYIGTMGKQQQVLSEYLRKFLMECTHDGEHRY